MKHVALFIAALGLTVLSAKVTQDYWRWFVTYVFPSVRPLSYLQALALDYFVAWLAADALFGLLREVDIDGEYVVGKATYILIIWGLGFLTYWAVLR